MVDGIAALWLIDYESTFKTFTISYSFSEQERLVYNAVQKGDTVTLKSLLQNRQHQDQNPIIAKNNKNGKETLYTKLTLGTFLELC